MNARCFVLALSLGKQHQRSAYRLRYHTDEHCPSLRSRGLNPSEPVYFDARLIPHIRIRPCARCTTQTTTQA